MKDGKTGDETSCDFMCAHTRPRVDLYRSGCAQLCKSVTSKYILVCVNRSVNAAHIRICLVVTGSRIVAHSKTYMYV